MDGTPWLGGLVCAALIGMAKTGLPGMGILAVPVMAHVWGDARSSVGAILPMLIAADVMAVLFYRRHADWSHLIRLGRWILLGMVAGYAVLATIGPQVFNCFLGALILSLVGLEVVRSRLSWDRLPHHPAFAAFIGIATGFTTMVGNIAGPVMSIYLLCHGLDKNRFMGSNGWLFLILNVSKVPFMAQLGLITAPSLVFNLRMLPGIVLGAFFGHWLLKLISLRVFAILVQTLAVGSGLWLMLK
jgi:uncharacterized protein